MNGRKASVSYSTNFGSPEGGARRGSHGSNNAALILAVGIVACFWAAHPCKGQIEVDAYIPNEGSDNVSIIKMLSTGTTVSTLPLVPGSGPVGAAVTPDGRFAYITNAGPGAATGTTVSVLDVPSSALLTNITVGTAPSGVAVTPNAQFAYVTNSVSGTVSVISTVTNSVTTTIPGAGSQLQDVAITPDGKFAYVAARGADSVSVINTTTNAVIGAPITVGTNPVGIAITPDGNFVYVANNVSNSVSVIATASNTVVNTIDLGTADATGAPLGVAVTPDGTQVYVTLTDAVSVINAASSAVQIVPGFSIADRPAGVAVTPNGALALVANFTAGTVSVIDTLTNTVVDFFTVGTNPVGLGAFIGPNIIVTQGGPLKIANDAALTPLGFGTFVDFNGGTLQTTGSLITSRTFSLLAGGGTIDTNGFDSAISGTIINSGLLTKTGAGTLTLSGNNTYTGGTAINGGILAISADVNLGAVSGGLTFNGGTLQTLASFSTLRATTLNAAGGTFDPAAGTTFTEDGAIVGVGGLSKTGAGTVILGGTNSYTGGTTVDAGTLQAGSAGSFVNNTAYTVDGGTLDLNNFNLTMSSLNGTGGAVNLGSAALIINDTGTAVYAGNIQGTGSLTKTGAGTQILSGNNTYIGGTTVLAGTLRAGSAGGFVNNTAYTVNGGTLDLNNFNLTMSSLNGAGGAVNLGSAALTINDTGTDVYAGNIQGTGSLTKTGAGVLTLSGNNSYSGGTTVEAGTLQSGSAGGFVNNTAYTVNGGTLDLNNFNLTMSSLNGTGGVVNLGAAALTVNDAGMDAYSGIIQGTGSLSKSGAGALTLSGNNTYSGGTNLAGGVLSVSRDSNLGAASGGLTFNGGTLQTLASFSTLRTATLNAAGGTFDPAAGTTFVEDGVITGTGGLTKIGAGMVILAGNNSYTGGTTVVAGTLQSGSAGGFVSNTAYTVNGGTLDLNNFNLTMSSLNGTGGLVNLGSAALTINDTGTNIYSGNIQGSGSLTKVGTGTQTLSGNNAYRGGTTVVAGRLQAGSAGGFVTNTAYTINGGTLDLNNFSLIMSSLNGTGGVVNLGSAALTVNNTGTDAYSGIIQGTGSLTKNGAGALTISGHNSFSGGTLLNSGTLVVNSTQALGLGNVVVNGGVLRTDSPPINVNGNYTQNAGGTLQLNLRGSAPGQFDALNVGGRATLDGTLQLFAVNGFQPKIGDRLTLVLAAGGVTGEFANVPDPFSSLIAFEVLYLPNSVVLELGANFAAFAQTPNQLAVARQLDNVAFDPRETQLISFLQNEPLSNLGADFEKISPDSLTALYEISFSAANVQAANLENRFSEIRNGATGFTSSLNISNSPGTVGQSKDGKAVIEPNKNVLTPSPENKWGVWIGGSGDFVNVSGDGNGKGYDFTTGGISFGVDYRLTRNFAVGIAAEYAHTWTNLTGNGNIDVNSGRGGLYATFYQGGFYLNGYAGGGYNSYNAQRNALGGDATGSTNGGEFDGYAGGGYEFHCGGFTFGPIASLQYTYVGVSGYNESGSLAPLRIVSQSQDSLRTSLGLSASHTWKAGKVQLRPSLRASWQHEYLYSALPIEAQFASGAGSVFTVQGPAEGHNSALIDAGVDLQWTPRIGTYLGYLGQVGRTNYNSNSVIGSVHMDF